MAVLSLGFIPSVAHADHPLEPDLVTIKLRASEMEIALDGKKTLLRLSNRVGNQGDGPLEIRPSTEFTDCDGDGEAEDELVGYQRVYEHSWTPGVDDSPSTDTEVGCVIYHPQHSHWHVASIARYSLFDEETGDLTDGNKVGFCLLDSGRLDGGFMPGPYTNEGCGSPELFPTLTGISPGYFDLYGSSTPGQRINVSGLETGMYCLRSTADPDSDLIESDTTNNVAEVQIRLNPARQVVKKLSRTCELGT
ncbi:MAG: lysyl oxidase family protein [Actinomycetota bacterium]|nr:lysyl oxidase family protein [Actinomycetota bacterium]